MRIPDPHDGEEIGANLTPMVDVVFLLLTFFLLATTFLDPEKEMDIDLPNAESGTESNIEPDELIINVQRDGTVHLAGAAIDEEKLLEQLRRAAVRNPETQVTIRGDRLVHHENIIGVIDACGIAGLSKLAVSILEES